MEFGYLLFSNIIIIYTISMTGKFSRHDSSAPILAFPGCTGAVQGGNTRMGQACAVLG